MGFNRFTKDVLNVSALPDKVENQAQQLKATFDQAGADIKEALNDLMTQLEASTSASNIGANVTSVTTKTVQAILTAFEGAIANRYTKAELDALISTNTNNLVAGLDVNLTTGVITVTKKDGTVETFDTAIEKVPAKFEIVENAGNYALKITNVDGTSTQTDITHLMNIYNFNNSDTINFEVVGEGSEKTVVATIKANSIGLDKLSLTAVSTLEGYMNSAKDSATAAKTSETNARTSEINAANSASTAISKAAEATTGASTATTKAAEAIKSAEDAEYWAGKAQEFGNGDFVTNSVFNEAINERYTKSETNAQINSAVANKTDKSYVDGQISAVNNQISGINTTLNNKVDANQLNTLQADLYTVDRYNTPTYSGNDMILNLSLTSYEVGKIVKITAPATLTNPTININNLGAKQINGTIEAGEKYILVYNGESWDIQTTVVTGTYTGDSTTNREIPLDFTPTSLIVVAVESGAVTFAINNGTRSSGITGVTNVTGKEYAYGQMGGGRENMGVTIGQNKFTINGSSTGLDGFNYNRDIYNYIAFR